MATPIYQDLSCQDLLDNPDRWKGVAKKVRSDWERCLRELQTFEDLLEKDRLKRLRWAKAFRIFGFCLTTFQNTIAGIAAAIPFMKTSVPDGVAYGFSVATFVLSLTLWTRLGERSKKYLVLATDNEKLVQMCKTIRRRLKEIMADGRITASERDMIRDMMGQMHKSSEEIGSMDLLMKILGGTNDTSASPNRIFGNSQNYRDAHQGISDIIDQIGRSQQEIMSGASNVVREYQRSLGPGPQIGGGTQILFGPPGPSIRPYGSGPINNPYI
jgi:hypothetical protein